jgi:hypothetical protein
MSRVSRCDAGLKRSASNPCSIRCTCSSVVFWAGRCPKCRGPSGARSSSPARRTDGCLTRKGTRTRPRRLIWRYSILPASEFIENGPPGFAIFTEAASNLWRRSARPLRAASDGEKADWEKYESRSNTQSPLHDISLLRSGILLSWRLEPVISCRQLTKRFGAATAVDSLSLDVEKGTICAFLGPNPSSSLH